MDERKAARDGADRIGEILLAADLLSREELRQALEVQRLQGGRLGHILVDAGLVDQDDFADALAAQLGLPRICLEGYQLDPRVTSMLPRGTLEHHRILPLQVIGNRVTLAMADPFNQLARRELERASGLEVRPVIASSADILGAVARVHQDLSRRASLYEALHRLRERDEVAEPAPVSRAV